MRFSTKAVHAGYQAEATTGACSLPIYGTASYAYEGPDELSEAFVGRRFGHIYSRISNPTVSAFEVRMNALENGRGAVATSSGMSAIATAVLTLASQGDEIASSTSLFGGTLHLFNDVFSRCGIVTRYADPCDLDAFAAILNERTRLIFVESLGNPKLDVPDVAGLAALAAGRGIPLVIDSTLTPPCIFQPRDFGAAVSVHSATKYITGNGTAIGGVLVDLGTFDWTTSRSEHVAQFGKRAGRLAFLAAVRKTIATNLGTAPSPFNAYLHCTGLETLPLRVKAHCSNAGKLAGFLARHPKVVEVNYPGLAASRHHDRARQQFDAPGGLLTVRLGSKEGAFRLLRSLKLARNVANLGDVKTLVIHPASTIYSECSQEECSRAGVSDDLVRVSVGIEDSRDIIADFRQALKQV